MRKSTTDLSDSELLTLKCIWDAGRDLSAAEIRTSLKDNYDKAWEPPTVCTFLARIESKGYISVRRKPRGTGKGLSLIHIWPSSERIKYAAGSLSAALWRFWPWDLLVTGLLIPCAT